MTVEPKPVQPAPIKKETKFFFVVGKMLDFFEWDARRGVISMIVGVILIAGVTQFALYQWQFWILLIGIMLLVIPMFMRGSLFGGASERKLHDATFMCIPKEVIVKQTEIAKMMHEAHHKKEEGGDKMPN